MLPLVVSFIFLFALSGIGLFLLAKDRQFWQSQYQELLKTSRQREEALFDSLLKSKGVKPLAAAKPKEVEVETRTFIDPEDFADYEDRLQERVEVGLMSEEHKQQLTTYARTGYQTKEELDRSLWQNPARKYEGSEADVF